MMVSREIYDSWKVNPPCYKDDICMMECPLYPICWPEDFADEDEDEDEDDQDDN